MRKKGFVVAAKRRAETMEENRLRLIVAARKAFAASGFAAASMDDLTAEVGLTRGALYHNFGDKKGLLAAVVAQVDGEMAARAHQAGMTVDLKGSPSCISRLDIANRSSTLYS